MYCKNWEDNIKMMPKLRTYIKFKKVFGVEADVLSFMSRQRRSLFIFAWGGRFARVGVIFSQRRGTLTFVN